ncbi:hypothetical protein Tco_1227726 [Tanacetum coccineum]
MIEGKPFKTEHKLNEYSHIKPIKQKRRGLGPDRSTAACKEVEELTKAGILWKVKHQTWVANPVMVKKSDGGWRMCIDFTDINKACPKDCYPLLEIDWKNTEATYQRLVDKVFHDQIGRNLEAYVDDIVIKSTSEENMLADIKEILERTSHYQARHTSKPFECKKAITDVEQPKTLNDIQSLNGKLAALSRFLSRGAERSLPFFKTLKSCTNKKNIWWTQEAEAALQEIKKFVEDFPMLTTPM